MKELRVNDLIDFRQKSERAKRNFVDSIRIDSSESKLGGGGNYWIRSLSAIRKSYWTGELGYISEKIKELELLLSDVDYERTEEMYQRNISILNRFIDFDFNQWKPDSQQRKIKQHKSDQRIFLKDIEIKVSPQFVFSFDDNDIEEVGGIWFVSKLRGFEIAELGMFTDLLYKYLIKHFSEDTVVNPDYCMAVDIVNIQTVTYTQLLKKEVPRMLTKTISEIKKLL